MKYPVYQEIILEHAKRPHNYGPMANARRIEAHNTLCGDHLVIYLKIDNDVLVDISFTGQGCAISMASASMMTDELKGKTLVAAKSIAVAPVLIYDTIRLNPARMKCAMMSWETVLFALENPE